MGNNLDPNVSSYKLPKGLLEPQAVVVNFEKEKSFLIFGSHLNNNIYKYNVKSNLFELYDKY